jgi:hypothetical protein
LLGTSAKDDREHHSDFFSTLESLAQKQGQSLEKLLESPFVDEGYAVRVNADDTNYVVAILRGNTPFIPGKDTQYLLLFDTKGRLLDRLSCSINNRLTRTLVNHTDNFCTDVSPLPKDDGAQLVIRYAGSTSGNWSHEIAHAGRTFSYHWDQDGPTVIASRQLDRNGLCRVAIRNGRFSVLFPSLLLAKNSIIFAFVAGVGVLVLFFFVHRVWRGLISSDRIVDLQGRNEARASNPQCDPQ